MESDEIRKYKQVILIRSDVKMDCGKKCVQVAHASIMAFNLVDHTDVAYEWLINGMRKIVLKVNNMEELNNVIYLASRAGIRSATVIDAGLTQLEPNTITCVGFQPLSENSEECVRLNELTKDLKLL
jgi:PTH2 family peptidyl-tRNA hydrolase